LASYFFYIRSSISRPEAFGLSFTVFGAEFAVLLARLHRTATDWARAFITAREFAGFSVGADGINGVLVARDGVLLFVRWAKGFYERHDTGFKE